MAALVLNPERAGFSSVFWMVSAVLSADLSVRRDDVASALKAAGVDSRPFFVPMTELPHLRPYRAVGASGDGCPVSASLLPVA
ncbi:MAG: hypothetical protein IPM35_08875 [Myxococcales bacterium]|nr:hypothetical protein [Myxococcales bacterium]